MLRDERDGEADRAHARDQHAVAPRHVCARTGGVGGAEAAGDEGAVEVSERLGESYEGLGVGEEVFAYIILSELLGMDENDSLSVKTYHARHLAAIHRRA